MNANYTAFQLVYFKKGTRVNDDAAAMRTAVADIEKEQITAVSEYVQSLR